MNSDSQIAALARLIHEASRAVVFTGAGISTESGIPDFRSPGGIWTQMAPIYFDDFLASEEARRETWRRRFAMEDHFGGATPNRGHRAVDALVRRGKVSAVITQNIDGLHQASGIPPEKIIELHGNTTYATCLDCGARYEIADLRAVFERDGAVPPCDALPRPCQDRDGVVRPVDAAGRRCGAPRRRRWRPICSSCSARRWSCTRRPGSPNWRNTTAPSWRSSTASRPPLDRIADLVIHAGIGDVMGGAVGVN